MPLLSIVYAAIVGLAITFGAEAIKNVMATPGNWTAEMAEYDCRAARRAPHIGANDPCSAPVSAIVKAAR